jgi:hypothetical protein
MARTGKSDGTSASPPARHPEVMDGYFMISSLPEDLQLATSRALTAKADQMVALLTNNPNRKIEAVAQEVGLTVREARVLLHGRVSLRGTSEPSPAEEQPPIHARMKVAMVAMHRDGLTVSAIAAQTGRSRTAVTRIIREAGEEPRRPGRPRRPI